MNGKIFYGWWITLALFFTYGIAVGIPYYTVPFFYDYYEKTFHWTRAEVTLGFPLAAVFTLFIAPFIVHRFSPRKLIVAGTALTGLALVGFGLMGGSLLAYYCIWFMYALGYMLSGPIPHQVIVSQWFHKNRGKSMAAVYVSVGIMGGLVPKYIAKPLTEAFGFHTALMVLGALPILVWPLALLVLRDRPSELGLTPDGLPLNADSRPTVQQSFGSLTGQLSFWLLAIGSMASIGSIGAINQHMKFVFKEAGFTNQSELNTLFTDANMCILFSSIAGRIIMGWLADKFPKKLIMSITYCLVAASIPLLLLVSPAQPRSVYVFAVLFGFGLGADYMLIPMMAADRFGVTSLARAMAIILPADTIGQTGFPFLISVLHDRWGGYETALYAVFGLAAIGALAILMLPGKKTNETLPLQNTAGAAARR